ncbi:Nicotinamidase [Labilithrix luteola]|uniref:Nicotinamidase n=1 Tax=Labilithrix luteola TaxID=1391654 RepID=A0A0K1QGE6_9BACT|nr:isochorismatase family cysteine hydrolase [Labilithrix luteola]AKV04717.1 Nicotinamidase [Labilithrix luteola]
MSDPKDAPNAEEQLAELAAFALAARPERVEDGILMLAPPGLREGVRSVRETVAVLGLAEAPVEPPPSVRSRILETIAGRRAPRRAVVVIDMINDHLKPGALLEVPRARAIVQALRTRLDEARASGIPIIYVVDEHEPDDPDLDAWGAHAVKGTAGTEIWSELAPRTGEAVVKKPSYSAFFQSELGRTLDDLRIDTLVLTGCLTEIGLMATATDAMQQGYAIEVPLDSQAGSAPELELSAVGTMNTMAPFGPARKARLERLDAQA